MKNFPVIAKHVLTLFLLIFSSSTVAANTNEGCTITGLSDLALIESKLLECGLNAV